MDQSAQGGGAGGPTERGMNDRESREGTGRPPPHDGRQRQSGQGGQADPGPEQRARAGGPPPGNRPPRKGGPGGGPPDQRDNRKRRKDGGERRGMHGFGDTIERAFCASFRQGVAETWPVQSRSSIATLRPIEIARRGDMILFCDGAHTGPHLWPDGEIVSDTSEGAVTVESRMGSSGPQVGGPGDDDPDANAAADIGLLEDEPQDGED